MLGRFDAALAASNAALRHVSGDAALFTERGWVHALKGDWEKALADARKAVHLAPDSVEAALLAGSVCRERRSWTEAVGFFSSALRLASDNTTALLNRGRAYAELGKAPEALADFNRAIALEPTLAEAYFHRGRLLAQQGRFEDALRDESKAIEYKPVAAAPYAARCELHLAKRNIAAAARDAYTAMELDPKNLRPHSVIATIALSAGDWHALADCAQRALAQRPGDGSWLRHLGRARKELGQNREALAAYDQALAADPRDWTVRCERATASLALGDFAAAIKDASDAIAISPTAVAYALRSFARFKGGDVDRAYEDCTNALTLDATDVTARLVRATIYIKWNRTREAMDDAKKALRAAPGLAWTHLTYGRALTATGQYDEAYRAVSHAIEIAPADAEAFAARCTICVALGKQEEAKSDRERALTLDPSLSDELKNVAERLNSR